MQLGGVAVLAQLLGDHVAGAVDMGKAIVKAVPEPVVQKVIGPLAVAQVQRERDVFRLAVERGRMGNPQLFHMLEARHRQRGGHHEVHHIRPGRRLFKHMPVGNSQAHALAGDQVLHNGQKAHLPDCILIGPRLPNGDDPHLVSMLLERHGKPPGADCSAVIRIVKLVNDQHDFHTFQPLFPCFSFYFRPTQYFFSLSLSIWLVHWKTRIWEPSALIFRKNLPWHRKKEAGYRPLSYCSRCARICSRPWAS